MSNIHEKKTLFFIQFNNGQPMKREILYKNKKKTFNLNGRKDTQNVGFIDILLVAF